MAEIRMHARHDAVALEFGCEGDPTQRQERPMNQIETKSRADSRSSTKAESFILDLWGVRYQVADVSRSVEFYTKQLGFKLDHQKLPAFAQVSIANLKLMLSGPGASGSWPMPDGHSQTPGGWNRVILHVENLPDRIFGEKGFSVSQQDGNRSRRKANPSGRSRRQSHRIVRTGSAAGSKRPLIKRTRGA
jgi:hypothetical protein